MQAVEAQIYYEGGNGSTESVSVLMRDYHVKRVGEMDQESGQRVLSPLQKEKNILEVEFSIIGYQPASLTLQGYIEEKITDVRDDAIKIASLQNPVADLHRPPKCEMRWSDERFTGFLNKLDYRYTMFSDDGIPVCAEFTAELHEAADVDEQMQSDNTFQSPDRSKYRPVYEKTQLYQMAYQEYRDASLWRTIAEANEILNPLELETGRMLVLPPL